MFYALYKHVLLEPALRTVVRVDVTGVENIPDSGPVILAANHLAEVDSLILPLASPREIAFLTKLEYFTGTGIRGRLSRWFFRSAGQIPVDRSGGDSAALDAAVDHLRRGGAWGIYPEGTRSPDGRLYRGHTGLARVAERVPGALVIPVGLRGTDIVNPPGPQRTLNRGRVGVRFGRPIEIGTVLAESGVRGATDAVQRRIQELTGQQYVDHYAPGGPSVRPRRR
ncbi:lysophospholipid acyltransferase family protein [Tsukamurella pseudospumae]|uniref:Glycerol acyltransferase n=1 Tax=Tsukamurella pseudospumae TaxID=239498 RepID=A0A137YZC5_9ACTN|nr:lysophospholipid acyltransferase family protein [Tsukamurella pseudospumae]KXO91305.1 glycerol acyltransferase [Tsukamurella pseudospumae]